ncbi:MAG: response regulator transcription factor [Albidovulum sp.]
MPHEIHIVDDDAHIRDVIRFALRDAGYQIQEAANGNQALANLAKHAADLVILDVGMPELDGFQTCKEIRKTSNVPILFLTARNDEIDRVLAFELGGDDYLSKPFSPRELVLRIGAILSRGKSEIGSKLSIGNLTLEDSKHLATLKGRPLSLTPREFALLSVLAKSPDQVFMKANIMAQIYGNNIFVADRTLDSHVRNLRAKAREFGCDDIVTTVHGVGLKLGRCLC